jgi:predicted AlkP superfamily pyrophosphatase or phosphodiesterase
VVIISIDGMRPDALDQADTPIMDELRAGGAYCPDAQTVHVSYTLPAHASMFTGMTPDKNGLNFPHPYIDWRGLNGQTLFSVAHDAGLETAMVVGKKKMDLVVLPNSVDRLFSADVNDPDVKDKAIEFIEGGLPDVLFIHFPDTDRVGHAHGWMSPNQLQAIASVDGLIGEILTALEVGGYPDSTLLIITADHGGHYFGHGDDSPVDRTIRQHL